MIENILLIEDDITLGLMLKTWLTKKGFTVRSVISIMDAKKQLKDGYIPELVLSDLRLPDDSGISFLKWMKEDFPDVIFIMITGYAEIQTAVESIKSGAYDYIAKPLNPEELLKKIKQASQNKEMSKTKKETKTDTIDFVKGKSSDYKKMYDYVDLVAPTGLSVLIQGQSGVGKEHIARLIHEKSDRQKGPFVAVDCGVLSKELAASDLFGHLKGSFTGAINNKTGHFFEANKGTLFLDEIGNLPLDIQVQLLRVLQEKVIKPVGSTREISVDIRLITATNEDLEQALVGGTFRTDLYHRINEFLIYIPTLQECKEDIPLYAHHFLELSNKQLNKKVIGFDPQTLEVLKAYSWPGNIREIKNVVNRMVLICQQQYITRDLLPENIAGKFQDLFEKSDSPLSKKNGSEKDRILEALKATNNNKSKAATLLEMDRKTLYNKIKTYGIED